MKHSTGDEHSIWMRAHRRERGPRTATGEYSTIKHFTGRYFDLKLEEEELLEEAERAELEAAAREEAPQIA